MTAETAPKPTLWCVRVIGPDDLYAMPSFEIAWGYAEWLNEALARSDITDVLCKAVPDTWPWSEEAHGENLAQHTDDLSKVKARIASKGAVDAETVRRDDATA